jgi:two-component system CheB/CheR fusion protein
MALAKSHDALTQSGWRGSELGDIVRAACRPFGEDARLQIDGPRVDLESGAVINMAMVLHELATNAAKYGALATSVGRISIRWRVESNGNGQMLQFEWKEQNGPPLEGFEKKGFGSQLISSIIEQDLHGKASFFAERDGLRFAASFRIRGAKRNSEDDMVELFRPTLGRPEPEQIVLSQPKVK